MTFKELIDLFPSKAKLAEELDVSRQAVYSMYANNSINHEHWDKIIEYARERKIRGVTLNSLARMKAESILARKEEK